MTMIIVSQK